MIVPEVLDYLLPNYGNKPAPQRRERKIYSMGVNVKVSKFQVPEINLRFVVQSMCFCSIICAGFVVLFHRS